MSFHPLTPNSIVTIESEKYRVIGRNYDNSLALERLADGVVARFTDHQLSGLWHQGLAEFRTVKPHERDAIRTPLCDMSHLSGSQREDVFRRLEFLKAIEANGGKLSDKELQKIRQALRPLHGDGRGLSAGTLRRQYHKWQDSNKSLHAIIASVTGKKYNSGRYGPRHDAIVIELANEGVENFIKKRTFQSSRLVYESVKAEVDKLNKSRAPDKQLIAPSRASISRLIDSMNAEEKHRAQQGVRSADRKFEQYGRFEMPTRPMELVQIDHTPADVFVFIIDGNRCVPLGRPTITIALDVFTRMVVGLHIGFEGPSTISVAHCIRSMIEPKEALLKALGLEDCEWPCCGVPENILVDNGAEFHSYAIAEICAILGINLEFTPAGRPRKKPHVERALGTIAKRYIHTLDGTTFSNMVKRGDYNSQIQARLSFSQFRRLTVQWILDIYHKSVHSGLGRSPLSKWKKYDRDIVIRLPSRNDMLCVEMPKQKKHFRLSGRGITVFNLRYNCDVLREIRTQIGDCFVDFRYDPTDLSRIAVINPIDQQIHIVPCLYQELSRSLSSHLLKILTRWITEGGDTVSAESLLEARREVAREFNWLLTQDKKGVQAVRLARAMGVGVRYLTDEIRNASNLFPHVNDPEAVESTLDPENQFSVAPVKLPSVQPKPQWISVLDDEIHDFD